MNPIRRILPILAVAFLLQALCENASACSVCFSAREGTRFAFYFTTALLTFTPFVLFGSTALYFRHRMKNMPPPEDP